MSRLFTYSVSGVVSGLEQVEEQILVCAPLVLHPLTSDISWSRARIWTIFEHLSSSTVEHAPVRQVTHSVISASEYIP